MNLVAAVDRRGGIGHKGSLLVSIPLDRQRFRRMTTGKVVVMGRKTLESLPQKQPLGGRVNVVMSRKPDYFCRGAFTAHSVEEVLEYLKDYDTNDIFIMGGEEIYRQFLPFSDTAYLTVIDYQYDADAFFPKLSEEEWELTEKSDEQTYFDLIYHFCTYQRK